jgi:hypothetical protein
MRQPGSLEIIDVRVDVKPQFGFHLGVEPAPPTEEPNAMADRLPPTHELLLPAGHHELNRSGDHAGQAQAPLPCPD